MSFCKLYSELPSLTWQGTFTPSRTGDFATPGDFSTPDDFVKSGDFTMGDFVTPGGILGCHFLSGDKQVPKNVPGRSLREHLDPKKLPREKKVPPNVPGRSLREHLETIWGPCWPTWGAFWCHFGSALDIFCFFSSLPDIRPTPRKGNTVR